MSNDQKFFIEFDCFERLDKKYYGIYVGDQSKKCQNNRWFKYISNLHQLLFFKVLEYLLAFIKIII